MNNKDKIKKYKEYQEKINAYGLVVNTTYFDKETIAPVKGNKYRNSKLNYMSGVLYDIQTDKEYIDLVNDLSKQDLGKELNRDIYFEKKSLDNITKFTKEEVMEFDLACSNAFDAWLKAKSDNDYKAFEPHLSKLIDLQKKRANIRDPKAIPYNVHLDDYEEGMDIKQYDKFFNLVKKELSPLIKKVNDNKDKIDDSFLYKYYPYDKQKKFNEILLKYIGFDSSWGYLGESEHPFTNAMSINDVRITTHIDEYNLASNIFSVIHEAGHAFFEHNVDIKYEGTNIEHCISSGVHESQSRFLENYIGRRKSFWVNLYPKLQELFPENLSDVSLDDFYKAINVARSSLVRTEADELTYPMHILVRYEIEKGIFDGSIKTKDLVRLWNNKYKEYLGVKVPSDKEGILQDVHWASASFGYFPTYALGSAFGAQLFNKMSKDLDIDYLLEHNKFKQIVKYLKDNVQHTGALYSFNEICLRATGESFNPKYYINYLKNKYKTLYKIK